ncbi:MAG TPA: glycosyltransferase family 2 protein [Prevotella sp.]
MRTELSILIPTYNDSCLDLVKQLSAQAQTVPMLKSYEIIVGDDGSTDSNIIESNCRINEIPNCRYLLREHNEGRAAIRNFLVQQAQYEWLLFVDADMLIVNPHYLATYLHSLSEAKVIYGGYRVVGHAPNNLRFLYEKQAESNQTADKRSRMPYHDFHTSNFLASKVVMQSYPFDNRIRRYGYEDVLFGKKLHDEAIQIAHIDNPLGFGLFENNADFLSKTEEGLHTLHEFRNELYSYSRLIARAEQMEKLFLARPFIHLYNRKKQSWKASLCSDTPSLFLFKLYKMGYYLSLS